MKTAIIIGLVLLAGCKTVVVDVSPCQPRDDTLALQAAADEKDYWTTAPSPAPTAGPVSSITGSYLSLGPAAAGGGGGSGNGGQIVSGPTVLAGNATPAPMKAEPDRLPSNNGNCMAGTHPDGALCRDNNGDGGWYMPVTVMPAPSSTPTPSPAAWSCPPSVSIEGVPILAIGPCTYEGFALVAGRRLLMDIVIQSPKDKP